MRPVEEQVLIEAILANEDDDGARLVYADYLLERGDPRGEMIAVQCHAQTDDLENRALNLLDLDEVRWLGAWRGETRRWRFRRGFLAELAVPVDTFVLLATLLLEQDPYPDELIHLRDLALLLPRDAIGDLRLDPILARLRLRSFALDVLVTEALLAELGPDTLASVTTLRFPQLADGTRMVSSLLDRSLDHLHTLELGRLTLDQQVALAAHPRYQRQVTRLAGFGMAVLLVTPNLVSLDVGTHEAEPLLARLAEVGAPLRELVLQSLQVPLGPLGPLAQLATLERLDLRRTAVGDDALDAILALPALTSLNLGHTRITPAGVARILREAPPSLRELTVSTPRLSPELVLHLQARFVLHRWH